MTIKTVTIAEDYHPFPGGRYRKNGPGDGETFREKFLIPALEEDYKLKIILDGAPGYPSSFLEESFGGLVRKGYTAEQIKQNFEIIAEDDYYNDCIEAIYEYIEIANQ